MLKKTIWFLLILLLCVNALDVWAATLSSQRIAYVDIEKVFNKYKGTIEAKKKISEMIRIKREEMIRAENDIRELEKKIRKEMKDKEELITVTGLVERKETITGLVEGKETITGLIEEKPEVEVIESTGPVTLSNLEFLEQNKEKLKKLVQDIEEDLLYKEDEVRQQIMGQIYDVIKRIAEEEEYSIVISKDNVLYSKKEGIDLTDRVLEELNK